MKITEKIYIENCDNMELMARYPDNYFDLAIVDPPYGYGNKETKILNFRQKEQHREWNIAPNEDYFKELFRVSKNQIIWGGNYFPFIWNYGGRCFIYWHKGNPVENFADGELAWTSFNKNAKQFDYRYYGNLEGKTSTSEKFHPTQKPIDLYKFCLDNIEQTKPYVHGDWVLSNIIIDNHKMTMIDWDNIGIYPEQEYMDKLHRDLESAFGKERFRGVINDTTSI